MGNRLADQVESRSSGAAQPRSGSAWASRSGSSSSSRLSLRTGPNLPAGWIQSHPAEPSRPSCHACRLPPDYSHLIFSPFIAALPWPCNTCQYAAILLALYHAGWTIQKTRFENRRLLIPTFPVAGSWPCRFLAAQCQCLVTCRTERKRLKVSSSTAPYYAFHPNRPTSLSGFTKLRQD